MGMTVTSGMFGGEPPHCRKALVTRRDGYGMKSEYHRDHTRQRKVEQVGDVEVVTRALAQLGENCPPRGRGQTTGEPLPSRLPSRARRRLAYQRGVADQKVAADAPLALRIPQRDQARRMPGQANRRQANRERANGE